MKAGSLALLSVIACVLGLTLWPTLYRYDRMNAYVLRINRVSGYSEVLLPGYGWTNAGEVDPIQMLPKKVVQQQEREAKLEADREAEQNTRAMYDRMALEYDRRKEMRREWQDVYRLIKRAEAALPSSTSTAQSCIKTADALCKRHYTDGDDWFSVSQLLGEADTDTEFTRFDANIDARVPLSSARAIAHRNTASG